MKKRPMIIISSVVIILFATLFIAGNYFYNVSVNINHGEVKLHGGEDDETVVVSIALDKQKQLEQELVNWQLEQSFETLEQTSHDGLKLKAKFLLDSCIFTREVPQKGIRVA
jgi:hypothetical protein